MHDHENGTGQRADALKQRARSVAERRERVLQILERDIWPSLVPGAVGRRPSRAEEDEILGY